MHESQKRGQADDFQIEGKRPVLDVVEIVFDASLEIGVAAPAVDLCPAGDAGLDQVLLHIAGDLVLELGDEHGPFRAWADDGHVALEYVDELRQLIQARAAQKGAEGCRAPL